MVTVSEGQEIPFSAPTAKADIAVIADMMYADFFEPPPRPYTHEKPTGHTKEKKSKKSKRSNPSIQQIAPDQPDDDPPTALAGGKRSVRFSEAVKVKTIAARGSEFDKLVNQVGWERAMELTDALESQASEGGQGGDDHEDARPFGTETEDDDEDEEQFTFEDEDEMMRAAEDESDESGDSDEEYESDDAEGQETIDRLKSSLFDDDHDGSGDEDASPGTSPCSASLHVF